MEFGIRDFGCLFSLLHQWTPWQVVVEFVGNRDQELVLLVEILTYHLSHARWHVLTYIDYIGSQTLATSVGGKSRSTYIPTLEHLGVRDTKLKSFIFRLRLPDSIVAAISLEELFVNHNRQQFQNTRERTEPPLSTSYFSGTYVQPFLKQSHIASQWSRLLPLTKLEPMDPLKLQWEDYRFPVWWYFLEAANCCC